MKFAVCVLSLGYTRLAGITLYDSKTKDFTETTTKVARGLIDQGLVKGVKWKDEGFVPEPEFNMQDILIKTAVGKYRKMLHEVPGEPVFSSYMVVRVVNTCKGKLYEVISNKCQRVKITEEQLRGLNKIGNVAGVFITDEEVKVCDGVVIEHKNYYKSINTEETGEQVENTENIVGEPAMSLTSIFAVESEQPVEYIVEEEVEAESLEDMFDKLEKTEPDNKEELEEGDDTLESMEDLKALIAKAEQPLDDDEQTGEQVEEIVTETDETEEHTSGKKNKASKRKK